AASRLALGATAVMLAPLVCARAPHRAIAAWALALGVATLVYTVGPATPLFGPLLALPGLAWFRVPSRALFLVDFCWAVLAAIGLDVLLARPVSRATRVIAALAAFEMFALVLSGTLTPNAGLGVVVVAVAMQLALAVGPSNAVSRGAAALVLVGATAL